jgi:anti-sigma factor RsiW
MSPTRPIDEFTDEWLSAYVDSELTPDERAAVEERLQTDPAARQLLNELRRVSEAVKTLPRQTLGRDMRSSVLAEIARSKTVVQPASRLASTPAEGARRSPRVRTWAWAAAAIAAALMVMAVMPGDESEEPTVADASRDREATDRGADREPDARVEGRAPTAPGAATTGAAAPTADRGVGQAKTALSGGVRSGAEASAARRDGGGADQAPPGDPAASVASLRTIELTIADDDGGTRFERLLDEHGITLSEDEPPAAATALWAGAAEDETADAETADAVLVDAPAERIDALIAALRADSEAFSVVEAEEEAAADAAAVRSRSSVKPASDDVAPGIAWRVPPAAAEAGLAAAAEDRGDRVLVLFVLRRERSER